MDQLRIFISSPGDVNEERRRAAIVIQRIRREFSRFFDVSAILWEYDPMLSSGHFQDVIEKPSNTDIVVLILWSRLGTHLPPRYQGIDGRTPVTGTEWEFEDALAAKLKGGTPDLLVYRKQVPAQADFTSPDQLAHAQDQWKMLQDFWLRHFIEADGSFKAAFNQFNALDEFEHELEMHLRALLRERVTKRLHDEGKRPITWHSGSPYRGLAVFDPEHAAIFFGREKAEQELVDQMARRAESGTAFVAVFGASGSGKSSLLRAGVIPTVESPGVVPGVTRWRRLVVTPAALGADVFTGLANAVLDGEVLPEAALAGDAAYWAAQFRKDPTAAAAGIRATLAAAAQAAELAGGPLPLKLFLLVDQLEEIFTVLSAPDRNGFIALIDALAKSGAVWMAATMRSDFFARVSESETLSALTAGDGGYALAAPRPPEIERMIGKPAEAAGITFEVDPTTGIGLDAELMDAAIAAPGALPLLEFTLDELYRQDIEKQGGSFLTYTTFKALGGLEGAIAARAEQIVQAQSPAIAAALPGVIHALVQVGDDNRVGARAAPSAELNAMPESAALTDALVAARLLVVSDAAVRVAHEALLRAWPRAAALIAEDIDLLRARARAQAAMQRWLSEKEAPDFLLPRGRSLAEAAELLAARRSELGADLIRYIEASAAADDARRQAELAAERARAEAEAEAERQKAQRALEQAAAAHRLTRRTRIAAGVLGVLLVGAVGAGVYAGIQRNQAVKQRNAALAAQSHFLADASSAAAGSGDARLARLLALSALPRRIARPDRPYVPDAEAALAQSWGEDRLIAILPPGTKTPAAAKPASGSKPGRFANYSALLVRVIAKHDTLHPVFSGDGSRTLVAGEGHAIIYDLEGNPVLDVPHSADMHAAALDGTGAHLAQAESNGVRVWDVAAKSSRLLAGAAADPVTKMLFSKDGTRLLAGTAQGTVLLWSLPDGKAMTVPGVAGPVRDMILSPDGVHATVTGDDGVAALFDLGGGTLVARLGDAQQQTGDIKARALRQGLGYLPQFNADGSLVATAIDATHVRLWAAATGAGVGGVMTHDGPVLSFAFDGADRLNVSLLDGRTYVWAVHGPGEARPVLAHALLAQPFPTGNDILVTDEAGLRVVGSDGHTRRILLAAPGLSAGAVSPDGKLVIATADHSRVIAVPAAGGAVRTLWRAAPGQQIALAGFTPAGGRIVVFNQSGQSVMLDPAGGKVIAPLGDGQNNLLYFDNSDSVLTWWPDGRAMVIDQDGKSHTLATPKGLIITGVGGDGRLLATVASQGGATAFWDTGSGALAGAIIDSQSLGATAVAMRAGAWVARANSDQSISVWPMPAGGAPSLRGGPVKTLLDRTGAITRLRVTADGRLLSEAKGGHAVLWDPLTGRELAQYDGVANTRLSRDGHRLVMIDANGGVRQALLPPVGQALIDQARARAGNLSSGEQARYFLAEAGK